MPVGWAVVIIVLWLAVISLTVVLLGFVRQILPHLEREAEQPPTPMPATQGPPVGGALPNFMARDNHGDVVSVAQLRGQPLVLLFLSSGCSPCVALADELTSSGPGDLTGSLFVVTDPDSLPALALPSWLRALILPLGVQGQGLGVRGRPFAMVADEEGVVRGKQMLNTVSQLTDFVASALAPATPEMAPTNGSAQRPS
jgi:hypothetical protein